MRTSNKILLGGFLFLILLVTGLHVTIYAKYKSGHYTIYQPGKIRQPSLQSFPGVSVVSIHDIGADIEFGDVAAMEKSTAVK
ncbi:MAG: hypothetical protein EOO04_35460 [Chitinophagaceae bacterium]|nr:MAG: hypothetical protein EOO04_35460 [Chitinophagaceae bacterium]